MKKRLSYIFFGIVVAVFFLYYLFPKETVKDYFDFQVYRHNPDFRLSMDDLRLSYPPYITVSDVTLYHLQKPIITVPSARIRPGWATIFDQGTITAFKGTIHEGRFSGRIAREGDEAKASIAAMVDLDGIQLEDIDGLRLIPKVSLSGRVTGNVRHQNDGPSFGQGQAELTFSDCLFQLADAPLDIKSLSFSRIELELVIQDRKLSVKRLEMTGTQLNARFDGEVALTYPLNRSRLNLKGTVQLHAEFMAGLKKKIPAPLWPNKQSPQNGLPISISGTVQNPRLGIR